MSVMLHILDSLVFKKKGLFLTLSILFYFWAFLNPHFAPTLITIASISLIISVIPIIIKLFDKEIKDYLHIPNIKMASANPY